MFDSKQYWRFVSAEKIIGRNAFPGGELFDRLGPNASALDLGCGTGEMAEFLAQRGYQVTGMDINAKAIEQNRSLETNVRYVLGDITERLPFDDGMFDAIVISFVLVNILPSAAREQLVQELRRVLAPNGIVWVNEGLTSDDYTRRYELCRPFVDDERDFFVYHEGTTSSLIVTPEDQRRAIDEGKVARVAHHFTLEELRRLFGDFDLLTEQASSTASPNTKSVINMVVMVFRKP